MVVIYHFGLMVPPFHTGVLHVIFSYGNEAVNYFFFLSGFIMVIAYGKQIVSNKVLDRTKYWLNRFARIYPVYFLAIVLVSLYYLAIDSTLFSSFSVRLPLELVLLQSWVGKSSLNFPGWSLSVEMFFYLLFPFILYYFSKLKTTKLLFLAIVIFVVGQLVFVGILNRFGHDVKSRLAIEYFPVFNFSTFVLGNIFGLLFTQNRNWLLENVKLVKPLGYFFLVLGFIAIVYGLDFERFHHNGLLAPVYGLFLLIFSLPSKITNALGNPAFVFLGDISYSIYILQYPVWLFYRYVFGIEGSWQQFHFLGYIISLIVISALTYKLYEQKMQTLIRGLLK